MQKRFLWHKSILCNHNSSLTLPSTHENIHVLKDQEAEFYNQLAELSESLEFKVADFERFVDTVRETASRHLHTLVLVNADLRGVSMYT